MKALTQGIIQAVFAQLARLPKGPSHDLRRFSDIELTRRFIFLHVQKIVEL